MTLRDILILIGENNLVDVTINYSNELCGCKLEYKDMQVDHVKSVFYYNGTNDIDNLLPSCRMCNFYKSTFTLDEFRKNLETLHERLRKPFIYRLFCSIYTSYN